MSIADMYQRNVPKKELKIGLPPKSPGMVGSKSARNIKIKRNSSPQGMINDPFMQTAFLLHESFKIAHLGGNYMPSYNQEEIVHYTTINRSNVPKYEDIPHSRQETPDFNKSTPRHGSNTPSDIQQMQPDTPLMNYPQEEMNVNLLSPLSNGSERKFPKLRPINVCKRPNPKQLLKQLKKQLNTNSNDVTRQSQQSLHAHRNAHSNSTPDLQQYLQQAQMMPHRESFQGSASHQLLDIDSFQHVKKSGSALNDHPDTQQYKIQKDNVQIPKSQGRNHSLAKSHSQPNGLTKNAPDANNYEFKLYMRHNYIRDANDQQVQLETVIKKTETYNKMRRRNQISILDSVNYDSAQSQRQSTQQESGAYTERQHHSKTNEFSLPKITKDIRHTSPTVQQQNHNIQMIIQRQQQKQMADQAQPKKLVKANQFRNRYLINQQKAQEQLNQKVPITEVIEQEYSKKPAQVSPSSIRYQTQPQQQAQPLQPVQQQPSQKNPFRRKKIIQKPSQDLIQDFYVENQYRQAQEDQEQPPQSKMDTIEDDYLSMEFFNVQKNKIKNKQTDKLIIESRTIEDLEDEGERRRYSSQQQQKPIEVDESYSQKGMSKPLFNVMSQQVLRNAIIHEDDAESCLSSRMASRK